MCGREYFPDGLFIDQDMKSCEYLGETVGSIPRKKCGCGVRVNVTIYHCTKWDQKTTENIIPRRAFRQERSCAECKFNGEND